MRIIAYGGGVNSTALIIMCVQMRIEIDYIFFADTGAEKPHTYSFLRLFDKWLVSNGMPSINIVKPKITLEQRCLEDRCFPSKVYGNSSCSHRFKIQPAAKFVNNLPMAKAIWAEGKKVIKFIGIDADEAHRAKIQSDAKYNYEYPLVEWEMGRDACLEVIKNQGLPNPGKSACFFCPSSKQPEIRLLQQQYPALAERAKEIERVATPTLTSTKILGLGRYFSWTNVWEQEEMFEDEYSQHCIEICDSCYD